MPTLGDLILTPEQVAALDREDKARSKRKPKERFMDRVRRAATLPVITHGECPNCSQIVGADPHVIPGDCARYLRSLIAELESKLRWLGHSRAAAKGAGHE